MVTPLIAPDVITQPWALTGNKNTIPVTPDATPGHASLDLGFPPLTMTPIESGGLPASGLDMNGILNWITQHTVWSNAGGLYPFNAALVTATGGYKKGAVLSDNAGTSSYISLIDNNTANFNTTPSAIGTSWAVYGGAAASGAVSIATTGGSTTLTAAQYNSAFITVTGALTSNATLVFPDYVRRWSVINNTTGAFTLTAKSASTAGVPIRQGSTETVVFNGLAIGYSQASAITRTPLDNSKAIATTEYCDNAVAAIVVNSVPQYVNANLTAGSTGNLWADTSAGSFTITLPDPPFGKNMIMIRDITGSFATNNLLLNPQSKTIMGYSGTFNVDTLGWIFGIWFDGTTWKLI